MLRSEVGRSPYQSIRLGGYDAAFERARADMRRRDFIKVFGGAGAAWPLLARAQEAGRTYRIGVLTRSPRMGVNYVAFFDELRRLGFVEGQNLTVDARGFAAHSEQFPELAGALVNSGVDALVCGGAAAIRAAQRATQTIPIIGITDDMVGSGLVRSLAKPGGNTTGISIFAPELDGKRMEILIELVPDGRHMAILADASTTTPMQLQALRDVARTRSVDISLHRVTKFDQVIGAIEEAKRSGATSLNVLATPLLNNSRQIIIERTSTLRLPAIYQWPETVKEGGLAAYGPSFAQVGRQNAEQLAKVLRGAQPADLPVQQPTKFELTINLKTAKTLGITVPPSLLARADEVIE
jgi:putative ABC transport system substrate-binding protein